MPGAGRPEDSLVEILPVVLSHQSEGTKESPAESVEVGVVIIRILSKTFVASVVGGTGPGTTGVATELVVLGLFFLVPMGSVGVKSEPSFIIQFSPRTVDGKVFDALVCQDSHVDLKAKQSKDREGEYSEDDHVPKVLYGFNDSSDNRLQSWKEMSC